ncbi:copper resistance CopC family protein [Streptomyces sp. NPDC004539]|uniref:copper resistance CopC family protein n=1 Tax=Streptomyces sp. NPDC004539 TaxID=3154280 RepID=UPI0033BF181D
MPALPRALVVPGALTVLALAAPAASAHTALDTSSPASGAVLAGLPPRVTLTFTDPMDDRYAKVAVTGPDGTSAAQGEPRVTGASVTLGLAPASPPGRYTVGYRVVSADGHPVTGSYAFTLRRQAAAPEVTVAQSPAPLPDTASGPSPLVLTAAGILAAAGLTACAVAVRRHKAAGDA